MTQCDTRRSFRAYKPSLPLSPHVEMIWRIESTGAQSSRVRVCPDGAMALVIHLNKPETSFFIDGERHRVSVPLLAGPYSRSFHVDPAEMKAVIGVRFRPGAARMFFPIAAQELHNVDIALNEILPADADRLLNEVCCVHTEDAQFAAVENYLKQKLREAAPTHPAVCYGVAQLSRGGLRRIQQIQLETGLSHTRFIQLFREHVGLTPKLFCRVRRFRALVDHIEKCVPVNWAELAIDCGYFDQAHLIRDFRAFAGITPLEYSQTIATGPESELRAAAMSRG